MRFSRKYPKGTEIIQSLFCGARVVVLGFSLGFIGSASVWAEPVAVNQGTGQGLVFSHRGNCYLILPAHVHGRARTVTFATASPSMTGDAAIFRSFSPGTDLSVAHVRSGMESRCTDTWDGLPDRTDALLDRNSAAMLTRLSASGVEEHIEMRITSRDYEVLTAVIADEERRDEIFQGTSGAMLRVNDQIVGMAIQSANTSEATFLRIDEIKSRLARLLDARLAEQKYANPAPALPGTGGEDGENEGLCSIGAYEIAAVTCSREPVSAEFACSNLIFGHPVRFAPGSGKVDIMLEIAGANPVPLSAVQLGSEPDADAVTPPQSIRVEIDSVSPSNPRWRHFASTDMSPFGEFSVRNGSAPYAQRIKLTIQSAWDTDLPMQLNCVALE